MGRFRTNDPSDQWHTFSDQWFSDQWHFFGPMGLRTNGFSDQWIVGPMVFRTNGLSDQWAVGPSTWYHINMGHISSCQKTLIAIRGGGAATLEMRGAPIITRGPSVPLVTCSGTRWYRYAICSGAPQSPGLVAFATSAYVSSCFRIFAVVCRQHHSASSSGIKMIARWTNLVSVLLTATYAQGLPPPQNK